ncbi:YifB family Mg chelatase-like AAA ATPase [Cytobacillus luteolus]|uniref:YifB family Mg chelatase-like AAA ATPase n=1 Tax=Litchfieldia luteola TaxID=682179 RepID=UPI001CAA9297|nr:YifB family Mg chelatase-like AAA ATPase [Cytobacillus luteolus]MBP1943370.1 magnesium chelatase family protein [Cytobacillus luteolus]
MTTIGLKGVDGYRVQVEVQTTCGMEAFKIVGLPDTSVRESKQRVSAALHSLENYLVDQKTIVNLSPSEQKKNGPFFDLPIAIGILKSMNVIEAQIDSNTGFIGALSLEGAVLAVEGMLPAILAAKRIGLSILYMPYSDSLPALEIEGLEIIYISSIQQVLKHLSGKSIPIIRGIQKPNIQKIYHDKDFSSIIGHQEAKRALEVSAAGEHQVFMVGPPGSGKSMLAETLPSILPPLSREAQLEKISLYELAGLDYSDSCLPPIRAPHHSASSVSIVGGGQSPKPGEISLAHLGVLFLDEIAEFSKKTLDMLRQPIESGVITISRVRTIVKYPAAFLLIGAMNPCPCGYEGSTTHYCTCSSKQVQLYRNKLSGPMRDRFDINLTIKPVIISRENSSVEEASESIRKRVTAARDRQYERYGQDITNNRVSFELLIQSGTLPNQIQEFLQRVTIKNKWSSRAQIKILRLARTISDLKGIEKITEDCILEAINLHQLYNKGNITT